MSGNDQRKLTQGADTAFDYTRDCIYCINERCIDMLRKNFNKKCDGMKNCRVPWRDDGWILHNLKT